MTTHHARPLLGVEVEFSCRAEPEFTDVRGNALASGDDAFDRAAEDEILAQLARGNEWAWCNVVVTAEWRGFTGTDSLGCCSYASATDFREGGYFKDMKQRALEELNSRISDAVSELQPVLVCSEP